MDDGELQKLFNEQRKLLERVYVSSEKLRRTIFWSNVAYILLVVIPLVAAIILLPSLLQPIIGSYGDLLK